MPEQTDTAETATTDETTATQDDGSQPEMPAELKAIIDKERKNARESEKARKALERDLQNLRDQTMSEAEKAIEQARAEGRQEATSRLAGQLVDAEFRAATAGRGLDVDALLDGLDRTRFLDDEGRPDRESISTWIERLTPASTSNIIPDLGQGARGSTTALNGDPLLRDLKSKLGIR